MDYVSAKKQSEVIDRLLGYRCHEIERSVSPQVGNEKELWAGLDVQAFQTPYSEIISMIDYLNPKPGETWVDLGAAYGRMGVVLGFLRPTVHFLGYELSSDRSSEGNRIFEKWRLINARIKAADLISEDIVEADVYFVYDFGSKKDVCATLEKLRKIAARRSITLIARGRGIKNWIYHEFPWLHVTNEPKHFENWSVFRS